LAFAEKRGGEMILGLMLVPLIAGILAFVIRRDLIRRGLLLLSAGVHLGLTAAVWATRSEAILDGWFALDDLGILFLGITSLLFFAAAVYGVRYLAQEKSRPPKAGDEDEGFLFHNAPEAVFTGCLLFFLAAMTMVITSQHFGILWVAMEATTLVSAPLIYFHRHHRSLEATWKYLLICSVAIALALLGNLFLAVAGSKESSSLLIGHLIQRGLQLDVPWLKAAFLFLFVGYGTKMGLAPMHTWLPDAHSEAPSVVSALLSGALLNCAFLGVLRAYQVCAAAGLADFCQDIFMLFGIVSMMFAALFILGQTDYKRMLAYSSIEHMGILSLAIGLGGAAVFGGLLHAVNHSLTKAGLFFVAGNILARYRTKSVKEVSGVLTVLPRSGFLWLAGFLAITGVPPFGVFLSKFIILKAALWQGHYAVATVFLVVLAVIFIGMVRIFVPMAQGEFLAQSPAQLPAQMTAQGKKESFFAVFPTMVFFVLVLILGVYVPPFLNEVLTGAAKMLEAF
jgi:hydrogenase-4 component F